MVQTWWNHYWALSEAMLRIQAFFQKLCSGYYVMPKSIENAKFKEFVSSYSFNHDLMPPRPPEPKGI